MYSLGPTALLLLGYGSYSAVAASSSAAACSSTLTASYAAPSLAGGYVARLVSNKLTKPRGIMFDTAGNLLVVQQGSGIVALTYDDAGNNCLSEKSRKTTIDDATLNHGIEMSPDGNTLYASSSDILYSWDYSPQSAMNTSAPRTLVQNMAGTDHTTRTLLLSKFAPGMMIVTRGSTSNLDEDAADITSGHSQIKAFNLTSQNGTYDFNSDGLLLGWGLRNVVGIDEEPTQGGIYGVENSVDNIMRDGQNIHENNPAEKMEYFKGLANTTYSTDTATNYGYPECFAAWKPDEVPNFTGTVGTQFAYGTPNSTFNDTNCASRQGPRLSFQAHMAPLDILFDNAGNAAWVTFHGSWNRDAPAGYKLSVIDFANGEPVQPSNSSTAAVDIMSNPDNSKCPDSCFRPVGLAWDSQGRLFMSSDATGEIYMITKQDGTAVSNSTVPTSTSPSGTSTSSDSSGAMGSASMSIMAVVFAVFAFVL